jgi:predicted dehydrogenase
MPPIRRRDFARVSAFTLAWMSLPSHAQNLSASQKPVGYAAIGLGRISDIFMQACAQSQTAKITALVTGHPDTKGVKYAAMYGIPKTSIYTYETFDRILDNKGVDAVYIGLPNSMHCEYTVRAAQAGKHVLCEKPMAISSAECRKMIDACRHAKVKLMIGYRIHYEPTWKQAVEIVESGKLGQVESFQGSFVGQMRAGEWRLTKKLGGGGALLDLGIYPLNAIRHITGEEPAEFTAVISTRDRRGACGIHRGDIHPRPEWPVSRGRAVNGVDDEVSLGHHRRLRLFVRRERAIFTQHQRRNGLSSAGTRVLLRGHSPPRRG